MATSNLFFARSPTDENTSDFPSGIHDGRQLTTPGVTSFWRVPSDRCSHKSVVFARTLTASVCPSGDRAGYSKCSTHDESNRV